jgi:hypothetical protein
MYYLSSIKERPMEIFLAIYISGVITAMYALYWPAWKIIRAVNPDNLLVRKWLLSTIVVFIMFLFTFPVFILALLFPNKTQRFINGFVKGAKGEE